MAWPGHARSKTSTPGLLIIPHTLTDTQLPVAMLNLGPCSMLPPHLHPRAVNMVVAIHGNKTTYMYEENGARLVTQVLTPGQATVFPQGSMHMMMNTGNVSPCATNAFSNNIKLCHENNNDHTSFPLVHLADDFPSSCSQAAKTPSSSRRSTTMIRER